jgi:DNA-binding MarR family transcriptional regulator
MVNAWPHSPPVVGRDTLAGARFSTSGFAQRSHQDRASALIKIAHYPVIMTDQRPMGFWLKLLDRLIDERFANSLEEHGVTRRQWQLLNVLSRGQATGPQLDAALAPFLSAVDEETVSEHLAELVDSGWVALSPSGYSLADPGRTALTALASTVEKTRAVTIEGVSEQQYAQTLETLERMARNLGWTDPAPAPSPAPPVVE